MLRTLYAICEFLFAPKEESSALMPIPGRDPAIFIERHRADAYHERLEACVEQLRGEYDLGECRGLGGGLRQFATGKELLLLHSYRLRDGDQSCVWLTFAFSETVSDHERLYEVDALRQGVIVELSFDAGEVFIRPENFQDKAAELFGPIDIDFAADERFSRNYHVLADDERKVRNYMPRSFMQLLAEEPGLHVRLSGKQALFAHDGKIAPSDASLLVDVALRAAKCR